MMLRFTLLIILIQLIVGSLLSQSGLYPIVDTDVMEFSDHSGLISTPAEGDPYYGQDATYQGNQPSYTDHGDGCITDQVTGLTWEQDMGDKITYTEAFLKADTSTLGGFEDWRVPTLKELYSLILFSGRVSGATAVDMFINTAYFDQPLGDADLGEREIDAQTWSSTQYVGLTMNGDSTVFGVNFVDGRIKGYPKYNPGSNNTVPRSMYFRMVRGNPDYGVNDFQDNSNGTISDQTTGLMWQQADDGQMRDWEEALAYAETLELDGHADWRLPNAKELQSLVDYTRSPQTSGSPAIDPLFSTTEITDPDGNPGQYPYFWTGTTHKDGPAPYSSAVYIAFGEAQGVMNSNLMDVHGAGCQRSDPKTGEESDYPTFHGPQGDVRYVFNAVRCVRDLHAIETSIEHGPEREIITAFPNPTDGTFTLRTFLEGSTYELKIYDTTGRLIRYMNNLTEEFIPIDLSSRSDGVYLVCLAGDQVSKTIKISKQ